MEQDITQELGRVTREVQQLEHEGRPARAVVASRDYDTDIADLWDAISNPERLPRWFLPLSGELRVGGRYQLQGNAGGEIQTCAAPRELALTWEFGTEISWLEVQLSELGAAPATGTRLVLRHIAHVAGDRWAQFGPGAVGVGWDLTLRGLGRHLSEGASIERGAALAWLASSEGKQFVRQSSEGWCQAAIAAGEAADVATGAAARTRAAYTGETVPAASTRG
jgi:uncharacterized protein YndB with AHSA1/START domain